MVQSNKTPWIDGSVNLALGYIFSELESMPKTEGQVDSKRLS